MPQLASGLYNIVTQVELFGQGTQNSFWYRHDGGLNGLSSTLLSAFVAAFQGPWAAFAGQDASLVSAKCINWGTINPDDNQAIGATGTTAGFGAPPFVAARVDLFPSSKETRRGYKRFAGVSVSFIEDDLLVGFQATDLTNLGNILDDSLPDGTGGDFVPVIVNRASIEDGLYPATYSDVSGVFARARLTSQNTRKIGRGQ